MMAGISFMVFTFLSDYCTRKYRKREAVNFPEEGVLFDEAIFSRRSYSSTSKDCFKSFKRVGHGKQFVADDV